MSSVVMCLDLENAIIPYHVIVYLLSRLNVEPHDSLVQQLVSEAWLRIDRYDCTTLFCFVSIFHLVFWQLLCKINNIIAAV